MSKYSLSSLAARLAEKTGLSQQAAELFVRKMFDVLDEGLQADKQVKMKWLGTFKVTPVKDRESVDVNTGERIVIEGRDKIVFTPDNILKEIVNKPFAQFDTVVVNDGVDFEEIDRKFETMGEGTSEEEAQGKNPSEENAPKEVVPEEEASEKTVVSEEPEAESSEEKKNVSATEALDTGSSASGQPVAEASGCVVSFDAPSEETPSVDISDEVVVIGLGDNILLGKEEPSEPSSVSEPTETLSDDEPSETSDKNDADVSSNENVFEKEPEEDLKEELEEDSKEESEEELKEEPEEDLKEESEDELDENNQETSHVLVSRKVMLAACVAFAVLVGAIGWFAFNYGKMASQRDTLTLQLDSYRQSHEQKQPSPAASNAAQDATLRKKASEDSARMAKASEAVRMAENADDNRQVDGNSKSATSNSTVDPKKQVEEKKLADAKKQADAKKLADAKKQASTQTDKSASSTQYDKDVRIRTGAYRIVGVAQVVTVRKGQTLQTISKAHLGPGMECYVEALNGSGELKAGQKVKIPKLQLKKK